jgi:hypothetical protein
MGSELAHITLVQFEDFTDNTLTTTTVLDVYVKPEGSSMDSLKDSMFIHSRHIFIIHLCRTVLIIVLSSHLLSTESIQN